MRRLIFVMALLGGMLLSSYVFAEETQSESNPRAKHLALGFELKDFSGDYGLGLNFTTPYFANGFMALRVHGAMSWLNGVPEGEMEYSWMPYGSVQVALVGSVGEVGGFARFYTEAGGIIIFPNKDFSDDIAFGGYGLFGFEFFTSKMSPVTYFIEAGGMGTNANAEKSAGNPAYANGFIIDVGIRWYPY